MAEQSAPRLWLMRAVYLGLSLLLVLFHMLPLSTLPATWAPPDILLALSFAWIVRRPEYIPALALVAAFLLADFLMQRPPGLWTALCLIGLEWARSRNGRQTDNTFAVEWVTFGVMAVLLMLAYRAVLMVLLLPPGPMYLASMQVVFTILIYPLVVLLCHFILNVRRNAPGDIDTFG